MENEIVTQNKLFGKTFFLMFLGLLGSGIIAYYTYASGLFLDVISKGYWGILLIVELVAVLLFTLLFRRLPATIVSILYFVYAILNGVTLSTIFAVYEMSSIIYLFVISAVVFAILAFIGYKTNRDLSSWGTYITVFLIAGIILSVINLFIIKSSVLDLVIDWLILALFCGVTIYDINKIKLLQTVPQINQEKIYIYCAMQLYLDFINIFLRILSIFGKRRD